MQKRTKNSILLNFAFLTDFGWPNKKKIHIHSTNTIEWNIICKLDVEFQLHNYAYDTRVISIQINGIPINKYQTQLPRFASFKL